MKSLLAALALVLVALSVVPTLALDAPRSDGFVSMVADKKKPQRSQRKTDHMQCIIACTKSCSSATDEITCFEDCMCQSCNKKKSKNCGLAW